MKKLILSLTIFLGACGAADESTAQKTETLTSGQTDTAILAGGCFWCVEADFEKLDGVIDVVSGYTGGGTANPSYRNHGMHFEAAKVTFDPAVISYDQILDYFWVHIDPTDPYGQFCDKGHSYQSAIFVRPDQADIANANKAKVETTKPFSDPIVTEILSAETFWLAEGYHQDYYKKNRLQYKYYRNGCGRDKRIKQLWGKT